MRKIFGVMAFAVGAVSGFFAGKFYYQEQFRKKSDDEIAMMREYYKKKKAELTTDKPVAELEKPEKTFTAPTTEPMPAAFSTYWKNAGNYKSSADRNNKPYLITPDESGAEVGYTIVELTYYSDGTLADERDSPMGKEDIKISVGEDAIGHLNEYDEDMVCVRNPQYKIDYEIIKNNRTYLEVVGEKPYIVER